MSLSASNEHVVKDRLIAIAGRAELHSGSEIGIQVSIAIEPTSIEYEEVIENRGAAKRYKKTGGEALKMKEKA